MAVKRTFLVVTQFPSQLVGQPKARDYCTISINLSGSVTCDQLDEISPPASQHVNWDRPEILANCQNLLKGIIC